LSGGSHEALDRIREYTDCLLTEWASAEWQQTENGTPASYDAAGRLADQADIERAVQAVRVFTEVVRPDDLPRLAERWHAFHSRVGGRSAAVLRDVYQIHWLMVRLSDPAFAEQIADLGGR
jgi:hypothetical protein